VTGTIRPIGTLVADPDRLIDLIETFAAVSEPGRGPGVTRLAYSALERAAHALFTDRMTALGMKVWTDAAGNTLAERPGADPRMPAIGIGSHLDSVPNAGKFDGIVGVAAAMETARLLTERGMPHRHPVRFVVFAAEEGARFAQACSGSLLAAGLIGPDELDRQVDADGITMAAAMSAVSLDPTGGSCTQANPMKRLIVKGTKPFVLN